MQEVKHVQIHKQTAARPMILPYHKSHIQVPNDYCHLHVIGAPLVAAGGCPILAGFLFFQGLYLGALVTVRLCYDAREIVIVIIKTITSEIASTLLHEPRFMTIVGSSSVSCVH